MRNTVLYSNPVIQSAAALVLLKTKLRKQELQEYLDFRATILDDEKMLYGDLVCAYCGASGLNSVLSENPTKAEFRVLATIDHVVPISKGGGKFDKDNVVVACYPCNQEKSNKLPPYFIT